MRKQSFHDILIQKMSSPELKKEESNTSYEILDSISPLFQVRFSPVKKISAYAYPAKVLKKTTVITLETEAVVTPPTKDVWVLKASLSEKECSAWNLFEKTMGEIFPDKVSRQQVMKAFRSFAKKNHPDVATSSTTYNFAFIIKVKNEMLNIIDSHLADPHK